MIVNTTTVV